ncbi:disulfide-isomerase 5-4 [Micractinium conductrix]|uniref:Disulfide-isomerase 5-4 n=1 Tax=Micractinium conductrix TaxID=554055 RepID=A0A2P6VHM6_9CHLO|nr:disulfide-isomerase 5-4 [Micractinium conductrix]|eukprot:PSC73593.1 disulfide-isomerase 5-4 [Micractinium conductrix]
MAPRALSRLKSVDFYRKLPTDLTEATLSGATISIATTFLILFLLGAELSSYMATKTRTDMVVDRSAHGELLRINFNISLPQLSCEFATLDVSDAMGLKRLNLTKTVRKQSINENLGKVGAATEDKKMHDPKYDKDHPGFQYEDVNISTPLSTDNFDAVASQYDVLIVNFFAPWCPWCQRLGPTWEAVTEDIHNRYPESDGRIRMAKVDCTAEVDLCRKHYITAFPSIRIFRHGSDDVVRLGHHEHESYYGDRTKEDLTKMADALAESAGQPHTFVHGVAKGAKSSGCNFSGFLLVKKVPGTLHFVARGPGHSFDYLNMNLSHQVHYMYYGNKPSPRRRALLQHMHPLGLTDDWSDKLRGQSFTNDGNGVTYEHYMQVVLTTIEPRRRPELAFDAYEYTVQSHQYKLGEHAGTEDHASAKFTYRLSPIQIVVTEQPRQLYKFLTAICAVIGGVFTVAGIIDGMVHQVNKIAKKVDLGKQG